MSTLHARGDLAAGQIPSSNTTVLSPSVKDSVLCGREGEHLLAAVHLMNDPGVHGVVHGHLLLGGHDESIAAISVLGIRDRGRGALARPTASATRPDGCTARPSAASWRGNARSVARSVNPSAS
uniref:Uncharacterized protein n=1 Tax=Arundo donax TaxID=35708 RepID=A0A0A9GV81_ARUDO